MQRLLSTEVALQVLTPSLFSASSSKQVPAPKEQNASSLMIQQWNARMLRSIYTPTGAQRRRLIPWTFGLQISWLLLWTRNKDKQTGICQQRLYVVSI